MWLPAVLLALLHAVGAARRSPAAAAPGTVSFVAPSLMLRCKATVAEGKQLQQGPAPLRIGVRRRQPTVVHFSGWGEPTAVTSAMRVCALDVDRNVGPFICICVCFSLLWSCWSLLLLEAQVWASVSQILILRRLMHLPVCLSVCLSLVAFALLGLGIRYHLGCHGMAQGEGRVGQTEARGGEGQGRGENEARGGQRPQDGVGRQNERGSKKKSGGCLASSNCRVEDRLFCDPAVHVSIAPRTDPADTHMHLNVDAFECR